MLVFSEQNLAFIAVPKTGTTAVEMALKPRADIVFTKRRKHMPAHRFHNKVAPFLEDTFGLKPERFAVMREPEEQIRSWYRYRRGDRQQKSDKSTFDLSFDQFVLDVISKDPPAHAGIGSQLNMLTNGKGKVLVHHLFAYEAPTLFHGFLNDRFKDVIVLKEKNVSPPADAPLSDDVRAQLRAARADEFALYEQVTASGGHLVTPL